MQSFNSADGIFFDRVRDRQNGGQLAINCQINRGFCVQCQRLGAVFVIMDVDIFFSHQTLIAKEQVFPINMACNTLPGDRRKTIDGLCCNPRVSGRFHDGKSQWVLRALLKAGGQLENFGFTVVGESQNIRHPGFALGDRAGFVQQHSREARGALQSIAIADEYTVFCGFTHPDHN